MQVPSFDKNSELNLLYATDCYDSETEARLIAWLNPLEGLRIHNVKGGVLSSEPLRPSHVGAILCSYYFERRDLETNYKVRDNRPMIFLGNAAPRPADNPHGVGAKFAFAELEESVYYFGTLGPELSWVKVHIKELYELNIEYQNARTVFRSRFLPEMVARWLRHDSSVFKNRLNLGEIPEPDKNTIFSIDSFGNIKLPLTLNDINLKNGEKCELKIGPISREIRVAAKLGDGLKNELLLAQGTSKRGLSENDFGLDVYCQQGNAARQFECCGTLPSAGDKFMLRKL